MKQPKSSRFFRLLLLGLILCHLVGLSSCSKSTAVLTYGESVITENEYTYYVSTYKGKFAQMYAEFEDTDSFYAADVGGMTAEEAFNTAILDNVKMTVVCDELFRTFGLTLSPSVIADIDAYIEGFQNDFAGGSKSVLNQALGKYGINKNMLREIYLRDERTIAVYEYLFGEKGTIGISDEERQNYLNDHYVRVRHIYVNNKYVYALDENGRNVYNEDGTLQTTEMTGEALLAKNSLVAAIDESIAEGGNFEEIYAALSEDQYYRNGYYLTEKTDFIPEVVSAAFSLDVGEHVRLETEYGTHYVMRMPMDEKPWENAANADFFENYDDTVGEALFIDMITDKTNAVIVDETLLDRFSIKNAPINYRF